MSQASEAEAALQQLRNEVNAQAQRDLLQKLTEKCFAKCASSKGGGKLDRSEQMCLGMCIDRYIDCMSTVNQALIQRQQDRT